MTIIIIIIIKNWGRAVREADLARLGIGALGARIGAPISRGTHNLKKSLCTVLLVYITYYNLI